MELQLRDKKKKCEVSDQVFACEYNGPLIHQVVTAYLSGARSGLQAQKTRAEVRGGGKKPWKQKGTGRARAGTTRSPLWRKGGVVFAAKPRDYSQKVNKKMYRGALRSILSELVRSGRLVVVDAIALEAPKTKAFLEKLTALKIKQSVLIVSETIDTNLYLASRNLPNVELTDVVSAGPTALIGKDTVLMTVTALKQFEELLQ